MAGRKKKNSYYSGKKSLPNRRTITCELNDIACDLTSGQPTKITKRKLNVVEVSELTLVKKGTTRYRRCVDSNRDWLGWGARKGREVNNKSRKRERLRKR